MNPKSNFSLPFNSSNQRSLPNFLITPMTNTLRSSTALLILAIFFNTGCSTPKPAPNPLEGWKDLGTAYEKSCPFGQAIIDDYQSYIRALTPEERSSADNFHISFYEHGGDQRAVVVTINLNGTRWLHVLIYDQESKRIRTIKYAGGRYRS